MLPVPCAFQTYPFYQPNPGMGASMSQYEAPREPLPDDQDEVAEGPPYAVGRQARLSDDRSSSHLAAVTAFASFAMFLLLFLFVYIVLLHSQLSATRQSVIDFDAWKTSTDQWKQTVEDRQARTDIIQVLRSGKQAHIPGVYILQAVAGLFECISRVGRTL